VHELSIALNIVEIAAEESERRGGAKIVAVHLRLGQLSGVVKEALMPAYELATEGTRMAGSRLVVEESPVVIFCPKCNDERPVVSIQQMCCRACGTPSSRLVGGRELEVVALEILE